jgi:flagellar motor switch protein FliN
MSDDSASLAEATSTSDAAVAPRIAREGLPIFRQIQQSRSVGAADLELAVSIELGRVQMKRDDALRLHQGAFLELDKSADAPVDIVIHEQLVARGEIVVLDGRFAVRIVEVFSGNTAQE